MNLSYLQSYCAVINSGSFAAAADALLVSKGLVSRHVQHLEADLGVVLLHRTTRVIRMSEAGQKLYNEAQKIFSIATQVQRDIADLTQEASGLLRFTASVSIGDRIIQDVLPAFREQCPEVVLELNFSNRALDLASGENDIALRAFEALPDLAVAKSIGKIRNVLVASTEYLAQRAVLIHINQLSEHNCILSSHQQSWNMWHFEQSDRGEEAVQSILVSGNIATSKYASAKILAMQGEGIANLPLYAVDKELKSGALQLVLAQYPLYIHDMAIVHAKQRHMPKKLQIFKALLIDWFAQHPEYLAS